MKKITLPASWGLLQLSACKKGDAQAQYKRTQHGQTLEDRGITNAGGTATTTYAYTMGTEGAGRTALYL